MPHARGELSQTKGQILKKEGERRMSVVMGPDSNQDQKFTELVEQYQTSLRRMCYAILRDTELAKDAVQETFLKAYKTMNTYRGECSEKTWLMRIAINTCRDIHRSSWFRHINRRITPEDLPEPACHATNESIDLTLAIMMLPKHLKEVTLLYYYQNMTVREVAQALGAAPSTITKRLDHAQIELRALLEGRDIRG